MARPAAVRPRRGATLASLPGTIVALLRRLRTDLAVVGTVTGVVLVTSFVFAAIPFGFNRMADRGLRVAVGDAKPFLKNVQATHAEQLRLIDQNTDQTLDAAAARFQSGLAPSIQSVIAGREFVTDSPRFSVTDAPGQAPAPFPRFLTLRYQSDIARHITLISGRLPQPTQASVPNPFGGTQAKAPVLEVAISPDTAAKLEVKVGDQLLLFPDRDDALVKSTPSSLLARMAVQVTGLIDINDVDADYWFGDPRLDQASVFDDGQVVRIYAYALYAPDAYSALLQAAAPLPLNYNWRYFVDPSRFNAGNLDRLATDVRKLDAQYPSSSFGRPAEYSVSTGLSAIFARYVKQRDLTEAILSLASIGLLAVALTVIGLVAGLSAERRRDTIALLRSRGGSAGQVLGAQAAESLLLAAPVALVGYLLALALVAQRPSGLATALVFGIVLVTTLLSVAAAAPLARRGVQQLERGDAAVAATRLTARRVAAEAFVVALAVLGVYLVRRRGLSIGGGFDPYLAAVPVLLGLATGLMVLRVFPLPARFFAWLASLRRDLTPVLGLRRVARQPAVTALPLLVLLLAVAVAVFASVMLHSIEVGQVRTAWETVGADYRVEPVAGGSLYGGFDLSRVRGVRDVAAAYLDPAQVVASDQPTFGQLAFLAIDAPAYQRVAGGSPIDPRFPAPLLAAPAGQDLGSPRNPLPAIVSSRWVLSAAPKPGDTFAIKLQGRTVSFVVSQVRDDFTTLPEGEPFVLTTLPNLQMVLADRPLRPTELFVRAPAGAQGDIEQTLDAQSAAANLVSRAQTYAEVHDAPLVAGTARGFRIGVALAAAYSTLAIVIALALTARARARDLAFLRTLGLSDAQALGLVAVELGPPIAVAIVAGSALGIAIARLIKPGVDLTAFTGPDVPVPLSVDWFTVAALAAGLVIIVGIAVWAVGAAARRANLGSALRLGDE